eukprot:236461_1
MSLKDTFATAIILLFHVTQSQNTSVPENCSLCTYYYPASWTGQPEPWDDYDTNLLTNNGNCDNTFPCCIPYPEDGICAIFDGEDYLYYCGGCHPTAAPSRTPSTAPSTAPSRTPRAPIAPSTAPSPAPSSKPSAAP